MQIRDAVIFGVKIVKKNDFLFVPLNYNNNDD